MPIDPVSLSMAKKAMKSVIFSDHPPDIHKLWYDTKTGILKGYNLKKQKWGYISDLPIYANFDNDGGGYWTNYISIDIITPPKESTQYCITIDGEYIKIKSIDLSKDLLSEKIGNIFWNTVAGINDIRVFDDNFRQNYFWIEEFDIRKKVIKIWVKLNAGQRKIGIAFGNEKALKSKYNNGNMTFEFFDDFNGTKIDKNKWGYVYRASLSGGCLLILPGGIVKSKNTIPMYPIAIHTKACMIRDGYDEGLVVSIFHNISSNYDYGGTEGISFVYFGVGMGINYYSIKIYYSGSKWVAKPIRSGPYRKGYFYNFLGISYEDRKILYVDGVKKLEYDYPTKWKEGHVVLHARPGGSWKVDYLFVRKILKKDLEFSNVKVC